MELSPELIRGSVVPIVLSLLEERACYGYELVKVVDARTNGLLQWREGTLYPTLHRLEGQGLVRAKWREADSGKQRKYYHITRKGKASLVQRRREWQAFAAAVNGLLISAG